MKTLISQIRFVLLVPLFVWPTIMAAATLVDSSADFSARLRQAKPGDTLVIADGRYDGWSIEVACQGSSEQPIRIQPETVGGVVFTGRTHFLITGSGVNLDGFRFEECDFEQNLLDLRGAEEVGIVNCVIENSGGRRAAIGIAAGARNNRIMNCRFTNIAARCINLNINEQIYEDGIPTGNVIRRNRFEDIPPAGQNGRETIKIGTNQPQFGHIDLGTIVEENVFDRCNGEAEIISNKSSGNIYRRNVFTDCAGELVMRGGSNCVIAENRFIGGKGGIRICGTGHIVKNNLVVDSESTGIRLYFGMTAEQGGHYQAAGQCLVSHNTVVNAGRVGILIGDGRGKDWAEKGVQDVAPAENRIFENIITGTTGDLLWVDHAPDNPIAGNLFFLQEEAIVSFPGVDPLYADPLFRDPEAGDYGLRPESLALESVPVKGASPLPPNLAELISRVKLNH